MGVQTSEISTLVLMHLIIIFHTNHVSHTNPAPTEFNSTCQQQGGVRTLYKTTNFGTEFNGSGHCGEVAIIGGLE